MAVAALEGAARPVMGIAETVDSGSGKRTPVLVGAGDVALCHDGESSLGANDGEPAPGNLETASILDDLMADTAATAFTVGDNIQWVGLRDEYWRCFEATWGRYRGRTMPAPGNHDYFQTIDHYLEYFGPRVGTRGHVYYSYDLGSWHVVSLDSDECVSKSGCEQQIQWLRRDLAAAAATRPCTVAYWHHPLFSSGKTAADTAELAGTKPLYQALYDYSADIVMNGHIHNYERFAPQTPDGKADPKRGFRVFIVGTGGANHDPMYEPPAANSQLRNDDAFGVLRLALSGGRYRWQFVSESGSEFGDEGSAACHPKASG